MSRRQSFRGLLSWFVSGGMLVLLCPQVQAADFGLGHVFCPVNKRCQEKPPHWHVKRVCPKPVCDPCTLEHHGYYHTCWRPSSVPPDWSHCPVPPPAAVFLGQQGLPPAGAPGIPLPAPTPQGPDYRPLPEKKPVPSSPSKSFPDAAKPLPALAPLPLRSGLEVTPPPSEALMPPVPPPSKKPNEFLPPSL